MKRLLRQLGYLFARAAVWCNSTAARLDPEPARRFPPVILAADEPLNFSMQPAEYQQMALGCLYLWAPMRWPRRAKA